MNRILIYICFSILLFGCNKEIGKMPEIVGKWKIFSVCQFQGEVNEQNEMEYFTNIPITEASYIWWTPPMYDAQVDGTIISKEKSIILEITEDGHFIYSNDFGKTVRFKVKKIEKSPKKLNISHVKSLPFNYDQGELYIAHLKASNGQKFEFKLIYDLPSKKLVTVGWYDGILYTTSDRPVVNGNYYGKGVTGVSQSYNIEYLVQFNKIQ